MQTVHHATNAIEAHLLVDLLRQQGIAAFVEGEYLQGAIGELPASGLVRVVTAEADVPQAHAVLAQWQAHAFALDDSDPASAADPSHD